MLRGTDRTTLVAIRLAGAIEAGLLAAGTARAETAAPDVVLLCDPPLREVLVEAGQAWRARSHVPIRVLGRVCKLGGYSQSRIMPSVTMAR